MSPVDDYRAVRAQTEHLCETLETEDYVVQSMPDCSPAKWHLAHTSWFFETFLLKPYFPNYHSPHPQYDYLFNSYYNSIGERHCRASRGLVSRPNVADVYAYRAHVDDHITRLLNSATPAQTAEIFPLLELGCHHEQQHQELLVTDIKNLFHANPLAPVYRERPGLDAPSHSTNPLNWVTFEEGLRCIGYGGDGFYFDNEGPRHRAFVGSFALASRLVTNREWLAFIDDGGYAKPEYWLSEGWATVGREKWTNPLYWWHSRGAKWQEFTLAGMTPINWDAPVCHVSLFEADAYASWAGARLPTESEWEWASETVPVSGPFVEGENFHPSPAKAGADRLQQMFGEAWQWTRSQYSPYPGYRALPGALGEYNGKFMCNQFVLRGGSCATPERHIRRTYRNFFSPDARWQFTGVRLAKDA